MIDAVLRFKIVGIGSRPMLVQCRTYLLIPHLSLLAQGKRLDSRRAWLQGDQIRILKIARSPAGLRNWRDNCHEEEFFSIRLQKSAIEVSSRGGYMTQAAITGISPFFSVRNVPAALSFYC